VSGSNRLPEPPAAEARARAIDFPIEELPPVDEHGLLVLAPPSTVWEALLATVQRAFTRRAAARFARAVGCAETEQVGDPDRIGSTLPGFVVARVIPPAVLALEGRHRFSRYALVFRLEPTKDDHTLLRAETRADFPGLAGRAYRGLVIGGRGHVVVVNSLLRATRRRAEGRGVRMPRFPRGNRVKEESS
jgi:hypothetical protein